MSFEILGRIRNIYLALHQDTNSAPTQFSASTHDEDDILWERSSYPVCKVPGHCSDSTLHIYDDASVASALAVLHARAKTAFVPSFLTHRPHAPDPTSVPANAPLRVQECFTNAPPLDDNASVSFWTQTATEACSSSPNPVTTGATRRTLESSTRMTHLPALKSSAFTVPPKSNASTSIQDAIIVEHPTVGHTSSTDVELPSSPSPTPVQDDFLPIGMLLRLVSAVPRSKHTYFSLESHSPMLIPAASRPSRSRDPSAAVDGNKSAKAASSQEKGKAETHDDITVTPDVPSQPLLPHQTIDVAIAGISRTSSRSSLDTGKYPSHSYG
jgi:hypothetical protein